VWRLSKISSAWHHASLLPLYIVWQFGLELSGWVLASMLCSLALKQVRTGERIRPMQVIDTFSHDFGLVARVIGIMYIAIRLTSVIGLLIWGLWMFAPLSASDRKVHPLEALRLSYRILKGQWQKAVGFVLVLNVIQAISFLPFVLGMATGSNLRYIGGGLTIALQLIVVPVVVLCFAVGYEAFTNPVACLDYDVPTSKV
jgi:hypothetical protein